MSNNKVAIGYNDTTGEILFKKHDTLYPRPSPPPQKIEEEHMKKEAIRDDSGKLKWQLIPIPALLELCKVFHFGGTKYDDNNWRNGMKYSRVYRPMMSHFNKWLASTSSYDKESGTHHLMMVAWGCFVLYMYEIVFKYTDGDDRLDKDMLTDEDFEPRG